MSQLGTINSTTNVPLEAETNNFTAVQTFTGTATTLASETSASGIIVNPGGMSDALTQFKIRVFGYKDFNGVRLFSATYFESAYVTHTVGGGTFNINWTWGAIAGVDGYYVQFRNEVDFGGWIVGSNFANYITQTGTTYTQTAAVPGTVVTTQYTSLSSFYNQSVVNPLGDINFTNGQGIRYNGTQLFRRDENGNIIIGNTTGNYRTGNNSIDFQISRSSSSMVNNGLSSIVIGGDTTISLGSQAISIGLSNTVTSGNPIILGSSNSVTNTNGGIILGTSNTLNLGGITIGTSNTLNGGGTVIGTNNISNGALVFGKSATSPLNTTFIHLAGQNSDLVILSTIIRTSSVFGYNVLNPQTQHHFDGGMLIGDTNTVGSELTTNGTFTGNATGWTLGTGWAYSSNTVTKNADGTGTLTPTTPLSIVGGKLYRITFDISARTVGSVTVTMGGVTCPTIQENATTRQFLVLATSTANLTFTPTNTSRFTIDNVSVMEVTGGTANIRHNLGVGILTAPSATVHVIETNEQLRLGYDSSNYLSTTVASTGGVTFDAVGSGAAFTFSDKVNVSNPVNLKNYTVATLPAGVRGDICYVTDALLPTFMATIAGGGAVVTPVFYNGSAWIAY